ncbi:zf-HC2 domain-containing protein [Winogradskya humida]|uniref:Membrane protein n=1 Tax=Winogradskya humida TaxID=113566 RepID=A0ABQ3ZHT1_9ACTN|nr:zf-HC2 domain-containing protein [Actinoplanes humidus]GIE18074.1 membrane protein [Actinoplanes humidus]
MTTHPTPEVIAAYADGGPGLDDAAVWSVEAHLETCPRCRDELSRSASAGTRSLLDLVAAGIDRGIAEGPAPAPAPRPWSAVRRRWFAWALVPWLTMTVALVGCAYILDQLAPELPSLVLLLAPVLPLPGVAVAWSRRADPAWELVASTPAAGLTMLLRRTAAVLAVVIPVLALAGAVTQSSTALVLLPSLACTAATIALGGRIGVQLAAMSVGTAWLILVVVPSVLTQNLPVLLHAGSIPAWALATVGLLAFALTRAGDYRRLASRN